MRKAEAMALWDKARAKAEELHKIMVDRGEVAPLTDMETVRVDKGDGSFVDVQVPTTDDQKASLALREAMVQVLSPLSGVQTKQAAIRTVLEYTKAKPVQRVEQKFTNAEAWLESVVSDNESKQPASNGGAEAPA